MIVACVRLPPPAPGCRSCAARDEEIALLRDRVDAQQAQLKELTEQVARLERLLSRNSGNSSMPPSSDDLPGRKYFGSLLWSAT